MNDWTGTPPDELAAKLHTRATRIRRCTSLMADGDTPTDMLLDEAADLLDHLAAKVEELTRPRCPVCDVPEPRHMYGCDVWHEEVEHIRRLAAERGETTT